ncbi:MAG: T9SS type A sorting domain-containing protein [Saprospiraceae bacterium]
MTKRTTVLLLGIFIAVFQSPICAQNRYLYVSDAGNFSSPPWQILRFDENGENGVVFISDHLAWPQDILFLENSNTVLITNLNTGRISKFNATTGAFTGEFAAGIAGPTRMKIGPDGLLYVLQWQGNGKVLRYNLNGAPASDFTSTGVSSAIGLAWDTAGNLYVSSYYGKSIRKYSPSGADLGLFVSANLLGPTNIWFASNGDLMVLDYEAGSVKRFDSNGHYLGVFCVGVPQSEGVDLFPNGNIAIGSGGTASVRVYDQAGTFVKNLVPPGTLGLIRPNAVVFRTTPSSSTSEAIQEAAFVTPSVGSSFLISDPEVLKLADTIEVYGTGGQLVTKFRASENARWDANGTANGVYYIIARMQDGSTARQKVVVQQ